MNIEQYTHWKKADEVIRSEYGAVPYVDWCRLEAKRIAKSGRRMKVKVDTNSMEAALFGEPLQPANPVTTPMIVNPHHHLLGVDCDLPGCHWARGREWALEKAVGELAE